MSKAAIDSANENSSLDAGERAGYIEGFDAGLLHAAKILDERAAQDTGSDFHALRDAANEIREAAK